MKRILALLAGVSALALTVPAHATLQIAAHGRGEQLYLPGPTGKLRHQPRGRHPHPRPDQHRRSGFRGEFADPVDRATDQRAADQPQQITNTTGATPDHHVRGQRHRLRRTDRHVDASGSAAFLAQPPGRRSTWRGTATPPTIRERRLQPTPRRAAGVDPFRRTGTDSFDTGPLTGAMGDGRPVLVDDDGRRHLVGGRHGDDCRARQDIISDVVAVPEPASLLSLADLGAGLIGLGRLWRGPGRNHTTV